METARSSRDVEAEGDAGAERKWLGFDVVLSTTSVMIRCACDEEGAQGDLLDIKTGLGERCASHRASGRDGPSTAEAST
jgi:hypothetical protein